MHAVDVSATAPLHEQLAAALRGAVASGAAKPGERLPGARAGPRPRHQHAHRAARIRDAARLEVLILPALLLATIALPIPLLGDRLPGPIATHWGLDGVPDGSLDPTLLWLAVTGVWLVLWAVLALRAWAGGPLPEAVPVLGAGEHAVWVGHASSPGMALGGALAALALAAAGVLAGGDASWILLASAVVLDLAVTWVSTVRVTVSARGVRIDFRPFGFPSRRLALERIERAEAAEIEPLRWVGWGYRWSGRGRSAVVVRCGPGLVLDLRGGGRFAVTVDEPAPAAGLVNDLRRRHAAG